jgi:hypothetical protein
MDELPGRGVVFAAFKAACNPGERGVADWNVSGGAIVGKVAARWGETWRRVGGVFSLIGVESRAGNGGRGGRLFNRDGLLSRAVSVSGGRGFPNRGWFCDRGGVWLGEMGDRDVVDGRVGIWDSLAVLAEENPGSFNRSGVAAVEFGKAISERFFSFASFDLSSFSAGGFWRTSAIARPEAIVAATTPAPMIPR